jgi:hypothetical protein
MLASLSSSDSGRLNDRTRQISPLYFRGWPTQRPVFFRPMFRSPFAKS